LGRLLVPGTAGCGRKVFQQIKAGTTNAAANQDRT
jgi:hypothetical protein